MNRSLLALAGIAVLLITLVWWLAFIDPRTESVTAAEDALEFEEIREQTLQTRITELRDIREEEFSYVMAIEELETSIPQEPLLDVVIEEIRALADSVGVDVIALAATPPVFDALQPDQELFEIDLTLSLEGQYFEILGFVIGIEDMDRLIRIDTFTMNPAQSGEGAETTTTTSSTTSSTTSTSTTSTTTTTTTTTTTVPSIEEGLLSVSIRATLFTRSPLVETPDEETTP